MPEQQVSDIVKLCAFLLQHSSLRVATLAATLMGTAISQASAVPPSEVMARVPEALGTLPPVAACTHSQRQLCGRLMALLMDWLTRDSEAAAKGIAPHLAAVVACMRGNYTSLAIAGCVMTATITEPGLRLHLADVDSDALHLPQPFGSESQPASGADADAGDAAADATADAAQASTSAAQSIAEQGASASATPRGAASGAVAARRLRALAAPVLVQLLHEESSVLRGVPHALASLLQDEPGLQCAVADSCALDRLASALVQRVRTKQDA